MEINECDAFDGSMRELIWAEVLLIIFGDRVKPNSIERTANLNPPRCSVSADCFITNQHLYKIKAE